MIKFHHPVFIITVLACALQASAVAAEGSDNTGMSLALDLDDGSHVIGRPEIKAMPVKTSFANLDIPLGVIQTVNFGDERESTAIKLQNGDKVTGEIDMKPIKMETVFGDVTIPMERIRVVKVFDSAGALPPGDGPISFGGINWSPWRTKFEIQGDKLVSLPVVRPGYNYGHGGSGRGASVVTNIGSKDWKDYRIELEIGMTGVNASLNPHGLGADFRSASVAFHVADAKESWNECGSSCYSLNIGGDGSWNVSCIYNSHCKTSSGYGSPFSEGSRTLAEGKGLKCDPEKGNKVRIEVRGTRIQAWVDDEKIAELQDEKMRETIGGQTLDHGGVSITWGFESMGWIRNFSANRL